MPVFDAYLIVDWSASSTPKSGRDSIWYCLAKREGGTLICRPPRNPPTRQRAYWEIRELLLHLSDRGLITLVGFDFPYAYPAGTAASLGLDGAAPWKALWDTLAAQVVDEPDNWNNRFHVASCLNERITDHAAPFWACPHSEVNPHLWQCRDGQNWPHGIGCFRLTETRVPGPQSPWKLYAPGSVGSQALLGIPYLRSLRYDPELQRASRVWPFETGFCPIERPAPRQWRILHAEIYPSLFQRRIQPGEVKDEVQVKTLATILGAMDELDELSCLFACPTDLSAEARRVVEAEEGWMLGVR